MLNFNKKKFLQLTIVIFIFCILMRHQAQATIIERTNFGVGAIEIDFDNFSSGTVLTNQYASSGIDFENVRIITGTFPVSSPNVVISDDRINPLIFLFDTGVQRVGINIDSDGYNVGRLPQMRVFDSSGNLLGIENFAQGPDFVGFEFSDSLIFQVQIGSSSLSQPDIFEASDAYDNLIFEGVGTAPVPEPSTFLLLGLGLVGVGFLKRKNNGDNSDNICF